MNLEQYTSTPAQTDPGNDSTVAIRVSGMGKCYQIYDRPQDRLWQSLWRGRKTFFREFWALRDVSFEIRKGETVGIIGRNGSGKSTLLQLIAGTLTPTTGEVLVNGRIAALLELGSGFNPEFTGRENVYMNAAILGLSTNEIDGRFDEIAAFADIGDFIDQPVKTYSSGMMLRLAFAVSVCVDPDILIVDEALAVGDMAFQHKCMDRLRKLTRSGTTLLFVSHDIYAVKSFCQRALYLEQGRSKGTGDAGELIEQYLLDIRDAEKKALGEPGAVQRKPAIGTQKAFAFGTDQGRVIRAFFLDNGGTQSSYTFGDRVAFRVEIEIGASIPSPALSVFIKDTRMIDLSGRYFALPRPSSDDASSIFSFDVTFTANLNGGAFFITLRLEDRPSEVECFPVDKQVGALMFHIIRPASEPILGLVAMDFTGGISCPADA
jgi:lipopolysaccharide transport system ATP-binding protein